MAWTNLQKSIGVQACKAAGVSDEQRVDVVLRNFGNAHYRQRISSTSPYLNNHDFAAFMAVVEGFAGGKVLYFTEGYWKKVAADYLDQMRFKVKGVAAELEKAGKLIPGGVGLKGWILKRVSGGVTDEIENLEYPAMLALITQLLAYAKQNDVVLDARAAG
jgi:hypothetical protein